MRISDWSSDVCSSDLLCRAGRGGSGAGAAVRAGRAGRRRRADAERTGGAVLALHRRPARGADPRGGRRGGGGGGSGGGAAGAAGAAGADIAGAIGWGEVDFEPLPSRGAVGRGLSTPPAMPMAPPPTPPPNAPKNA